MIQATLIFVSLNYKSSEIVSSDRICTFSEYAPPTQLDIDGRGADGTPQYQP